MSDAADPIGPGHEVADVGAWLVGRWHVERDLTAADGTPLGRFVGQLDVRRDGPARATSTERGVLHRDGARLEATRTLRYDLHEDGTATVRFTHGGRFHDLDLRSGVSEVVHPCAADVYRGRTTVLDAARWCQTWHVAGPTKAYTSVTRFTRAAPPTGGDTTPAADLDDRRAG